MDQNRVAVRKLKDLPKKKGPVRSRVVEQSLRRPGPQLKAGPVGCAAAG